ncbi:hypothetical protein CHLNCDRAFT_138969 [Chlorella variabilis]|uniref:RBR-type E3 ubiquitin transferase n=1 Tax=Chlorella variabilis TaxID=554065 RepID=E1ZP23_CHLVA|nr:hypothetical protein CHLNCDRAFT_138969 [Chlorella variabilis]EFN52541.1 hypothetical protein CHLNCDRAFT_138969 [Chlorella variabilis]|eukprot:XP_005844643.1 hypothetical protein CHLNCDRAFT_138969 [Chlorella variabilis]
MAAAAAALSEEALLNWQQQVDEVQALEAIYGDSFQVLEVRGVLESGSSSSNGHCGHGTGGGGEEEEEGAGTSGRGSRTSGGGEGPPLDAASLAELDGPCSPAWALHCSLMVGVEPHAGRLRLLLPDQLPQQQDVQQGPSSGSDGGNGSPGAGPDAAAAEVPASGTGKTTAGAGCTVQYLPPICMQLRLGGGYPGQEPPGVSLSALWLGAAQVARLQRQLLRLWHEQGPGGPVCYTWADWLQSSALQHLGGEQALLLADDAPSSDGSTNGGGVAAGEPRAGSSGRPDSPGAEGGDEVEQEVAEERLVKLLRYDAVQEHAAFQRARHTCGVCLEEAPGTAFVRLEGCRHAWCALCLAEQARIHVAEGGLEKLRCPDPGCGAALAPGVLRRVLSPDDFGRWEQLTLQRTLDTMPDAAYCPRCSSLALEDADSCAQCPTCLFVFCSLCNEGWHPGTTCVSAETKLAMVRRKLAGGGRAAVDDLRRQEQELLSLAQIEAGWAALCKMSKRCPQCGMATQKAEGCNKMACGGCGAYWCWRCGKEIDGYRHFRSGQCILFDEAEILRWEAQWEEMQAAARVMAAGLRNEMCGQVNHKIGNNNHLACWSCTSHFCYCCRAVLRGRGAGGSHFGPRGCKQHSSE